MYVDGLVGDEMINQPSPDVTRAKNDVDVGMQGVFQYFLLQMIQVSFPRAQNPYVSSNELRPAKKSLFCGNHIFEIGLHERGFPEKVINFSGKQGSTLLDAEKFIGNGRQTVHQGHMSRLVARENGNLHFFSIR